MNSYAEYKTYLWDYLEKYHNVRNPKQFFRCLNPDHIDNNPSMMFTDKYDICKCFSCGVSYDIYDLIGMDFNINSFKDKVKKLEELYLGYIPEQNEYKEIDNTIYDYTNYYNKCINDIYHSNYLLNRGITKELINKYKIGYDKERQTIVFPINKHCYFARSTVNNDKIKSKGKSDIWNKHHLKDNNLVYVTEGIIDGLSLEVIDPDIKVASINGVGNINSFVRTIKDNNFEGTIVVVFDNDYAGLTAAKDLKEKLTKINVNSFSTTLVGNFDEECTDINLALMKNKELLKRNYDYVNDNIRRILNSEIVDKKEGFEYE